MPLSYSHMEVPFHPLLSRRQQQNARGGESLFFTYELLRVERVYVGEEEVPSAVLASARSTYSIIASPSIRPA